VGIEPDFPFSDVDTSPLSLRDHLYQPSTRTSPSEIRTVDDGPLSGLPSPPIYEKSRHAFDNDVNFARRPLALSAPATGRFRTKE